MEDRLIALTPWVLALLFELALLAGLVLAVIHFTWSNLLFFAVTLRALSSTLPIVLRRISEAWHSPFAAAG
jgi:hypothetical protein